MNDSGTIIYGVKRIDYKKRMESQSGGAFSVIAEYFIALGGIVYACGFDEKFNVCYKRIHSEDQLRKVKGSKYVRAQLGNSFYDIIKDLDEKRIVLFIGTACCITGLQHLTANHPNKDKLYTIDFICHGTPSHSVYKEYLKMSEEEFQGQITGFQFRIKSISSGSMEQLEFENHYTIQRKAYTNLFYSNLILRHCCESCRYACPDRVSDFTVGDYWGCEHYFPDFYDADGVSLLFLNTERSRDIFEEFKDQIEYVETSLEKCMQPNLKGPSSIPKSRYQFWAYLKKRGVKHALIKYTNYGGIKAKIYRHILKYIGWW